VSTKSLARLASEIGLGPHLIMGRGEETSGGRERDSTLADALEAIIGAIYIDAGLDTAAQFVIRVLGTELDQLGNGLIESNPKGDLQERLQAINSEAPAYRIIGQTGPDHAKFFEAVVTWGDRELGRGAGKSKKEAEVQAASAALASQAFDSLTASPS
jgi:ribonuclease-3